ncbi:MAG: hypothetical protein HRU12_00410 [Phaeodactylibacter sp.]|nr:hypothetical protein [Phaeodactylibacter sp.]
MKTILTLILAFSICTAFAQEKVAYSFDLTTDPVSYRHYWKSTGYSPAGMTVNEDYKLYLKMTKAMKADAIEYTRPHYLLNHIVINNPGEPNQSYDWSELDEILDLITDANLKLIFEIMMTPHPYFNDWYDRTKLDAWSKLCTDLILHLQERYGKEEVRSWYFENTNEPEINHWWPYGPIQFLYYYDATVHGIKKADPEIRFGGPGHARGLNTLYEAFIQHIYDDFNFYTQKDGVEVDFITWHRKAGPHEMITNELELDKYRTQKRFRDHEKLINLPIGNDEADPLAGWGRPFWWRPTPWYAGFVAHCVDLHNQVLIDSLKKGYFVLSNDNAFMGDWYRRTHVARFIPGENSIMQKNSSSTGGSWARGTDERPETKAFYLIKKPDMTAMSLMAMQGDERFLPAEFQKDSTAGATVTKNSKGDYFILSYNKPEIQLNRNKRSTTPSDADQERYESQAKTVAVDLTAIPKGAYQLIQYQIDDNHGNPFQTWLDLGSPEDPAQSQIKAIQAKEDPVLTINEQVEIEGDFAFEYAYETAGVTLTMLVKDPNKAPPSALEAQSFNGLHNDLMTMLNWDQEEEAYIKSYDVFYSEAENGKYQKVNHYDVFELGFLHYGGKTGFYKVQAVDYWNRKSAFSNPIAVK